MFTTGMMESREHRVDISEVEPEAFGSLLNFAYTSTVEISPANVQVFIINYKLCLHFDLPVLNTYFVYLV